MLEKQPVYDYKYRHYTKFISFEKQMIADMLIFDLN